jgi:hypothetical protein
MAGGGEHRHVHPDLGNDRLRSPLAHPGDGGQPVSGPSERGHHLIDAAIQRGDGALQMLQVGKGQAHQHGVMVPEAALQRLAQLGELASQPATGQLGQDLRVALPSDQGGQHRPARDPNHVGGHRVQLDPGVLQGLLDPLDLGGVGLDQALAVAGEIP